MMSKCRLPLFLLLLLPLLLVIVVVVDDDYRIIIGITTTTFTNTASTVDVGIIDQQQQQEHYNDDDSNHNDDDDAISFSNNHYTSYHHQHIRHRHTNKIDPESTTTSTTIDATSTPIPTTTTTATSSTLPTTTNSLTATAMDQSRLLLQDSYRTTINITTEECTNVCFTIDDDDDDPAALGMFDMITNFFQRIFHTLFSHPPNQEDDEEKSMYNNTMIPTKSITPTLSNYSSKTMILTKLLRKEQQILVNDTTLTTNHVSMLDTMYNISVLNMELLSSIIDPMIFDMKQSTDPIIDMQTLGCYVTQIVSVIQNTTLPTIEFIVKVLYTKLGNDEMKQRYEQYTVTKASKSNTQQQQQIVPPPVTTTTTSSTTATCLLDTTNTVSMKVMNLSTIVDNFYTFLFTIDDRDGPLIHLSRIIYLLILSPLAIVAGILAIVPGIIALIFLAVPGGFLVFFFLAIVAYSLLNYPFFVFGYLIANIQDLVKDLLYGIDHKVDISKNSNIINTDNIIDHMLFVLNSPIDAIRNKVTAATVDVKGRIYDNDGDTYSEDEVNCEMTMLNCKNNALLHVLPF